MGIGEGTLGALVSWAGIFLAINQVFSAVAFATQWRFDSPRKVAFVSFFALSYFLQSIAILIRGSFIFAPILLVIAIPLSVLFSLFWSILFSGNFFKIVRLRVSFMLGLVCLALSYWLTAYIGPKVGYWKSLLGLTDQGLFRAWLVFLALFTIIQVSVIGLLVVSRFPALKPKIDREKFFVSLGLGLGTVAIPSFIVIVNPTYPVMLLIYGGICYLVAWVALLLMNDLCKPILPIGEKIGSVLSYHFGIVLGFLLMVMIGKAIEG